MRFKKFMLLSVAFVFIFTALVTGCTPAKRPTVDRNITRNNNTPNQNIPNTDITPAPRKETTPLKPTPRTTDTDAIRAMETRVAKEVVKIPGVRNATVLINNNAAYIGIDLNQMTEQSKTTTIKNKIINKVKTMEPSIKTVNVSADVDVVGRLKGYARDIRNGKPISGIFSEIQEMFRRATPRS